MNRRRGQNSAARGRNSTAGGFPSVYGSREQSWFPCSPVSAGLNISSLGSDGQNNKEKQISLKNSSNNNSRKFQYRAKEPKANFCQQEHSHDIIEKVLLEQDLYGHISSQQRDSISSCEPKDHNSLSLVPSHSGGTEDIDLNGKMHDAHISENGSSRLKSNVSTSVIFACDIPDESPKVIKPLHQDSVTVSQKTSAKNSAATPIFDICLSKVPGFPILKAPLHKQKQWERSTMEAKKLLLRPGIVLLKHYLSYADQVKIIKKCRDLGVGSGGFYQPVYENGGKMQLNMMCLGRNWEPENGTYGGKRLVDGAIPPSIPSEFCEIVESVIRDSHAFIEKITNPSQGFQSFPSMTPDICIVNFYKTSGRLGLHQDKDESERSIQAGLPVVSFSIGDSADFLYSEVRDSEKAEKVKLESGDVLVFGGKSRNIFHGVTNIHASSAPKNLIDDSHLISGRLNLTFREY